jgi:hypothetical protein
MIKVMDHWAQLGKDLNSLNGIEGLLMNGIWLTNKNFKFVITINVSKCVKKERVRSDGRDINGQIVNGIKTERSFHCSDSDTGITGGCYIQLVRRMKIGTYVLFDCFWGYVVERYCHLWKSI